MEQKRVTYAQWIFKDKKIDVFQKEGINSPLIFVTSGCGEYVIEVVWGKVYSKSDFQTQAKKLVEQGEVVIMLSNLGTRYLQDSLP